MKRLLESLFGASGLDVCYGLPVRLPYIVITCARMFGIKRFCYYPLCRICVPSDIASVHDNVEGVVVGYFSFASFIAK